MHRIDRRATELDLIRTVRDARFAAGLICPHCKGQRIIGWGGFSGRKRYRCRSCRRTFSDLTATVYSYSKKLRCWPGYHVLFRDSATVRHAAARLGVHPTTTFRWRHALLSTICRREIEPLRGVVELAMLSYPLAFKGSREVDRPRTRSPRLRAEWYETLQVPVFLLISRAGAVAGFAVVPETGVDLRTLAAKHLAADCCVLGKHVRAGPIAAAFRSSRRQYITVRGIAGRFSPTWKHHLLNVENLARRFTVWLEKFRGVASKYMDHYLAWHRVVDKQLGQVWGDSLASTLVRPPPPHPHSPRTQPDGSNPR